MSEVRSSCVSRLVRSFDWSTRASEHIKRLASSTRGISSEKKSTGLPVAIAALATMHITSEVFPIAGRAAMMIIWPPCMPAVSRSRSRKPVAVPLMAAPFSSTRSMRSKASRMAVSSGTRVLLARFCDTSKTLAAAKSRKASALPRSP